MARFSGELSKGLCVPAQRFVAEMVYGIQASSSVMLTEIGRSLEEAISLKKTEERLSRNLMRKALETQVGDNILRMAKHHIDADTLLIIDPSDLSKKYAQKMEYLARVRDGSAHDLANGYWTLHIVGAQLDSSTLVPLYQRLWSQDAPDFESENEEILRGVDAVMAHVGRRGIFVCDRGGDRIHLFGPLLDRQARFLVRLVGTRHLVYQHELLPAREVARRCPCRFATTVARIEQGKERRYTLRFGFRKVYLPGRSQVLSLLVVHGFGHEPLLLLTTEPLRQSFKVLWSMVRAYHKRWSIEETIRYIKTCYELENVRVQTYQGLQNLMPLLLAVMFFCACVLDHDARLRIMARYVENAAKRVFGIPDFKYYALADGLRALFARNPGFIRHKIHKPDTIQLALFDAGAT
jgi:hypothetical protein